MLPILIALAVAAPAPPPAPARPPAPPPTTDARYKACLDQVKTSPDRALEGATDWRAKSGGIPAMVCQAMAFTALGRWPSAATAFEQAAAEADRNHDLRRGDYWVEAGNSWLAADQPAKARAAFDSALAANTLTPKLQGEARLDRARASVAAGDLAAARTDLDQALALAPAEPIGWYLSAALARRQNDFPRARTDIAHAVDLAPNDSAILLEAGNVAGLSGDMDSARTLYERAARAGPDTQAGRAAAAALAENGPAAPAPAPPAPAPSPAQPR